MKKILITAFLVLIPMLAAEIVEYEGWIYNEKSLSADNYLFKIYVSEKGSSILLSSEKKMISLDLNNCQELETYQKICFNRSSYDSEIKDYKVYMTIIRMQPKIEISRKIDKNLLNIGETATFQITLKNTGEAEGEVTFLEDFPEAIEIIDVSGAEKKTNSVYWKGTIEKGESKSIKYRIRPVDALDKFLVATIKYNEGFNEKTITSDSIRLYSQPILEVSLSVDKEDYQINEDIFFNATFQNKGDSDIKVNANFIFPEGIEIVNSLPLAYKEIINPGKTETLNFKLRQKKTGIFFLIINGNYTYKNKEYKLTNLKQGFLVHDEGIEILTPLSEPEYLSSNQLFLLYFKVKNKNSFSKLKDLVLNTITEVAAFDSVRISQVGINETVYLINREIKIPNEEKEKNYKIRFNISYKTEGNETYSEVIEKTLIVKPNPSLILIPSISTLDTYEEEPITASVSVKNPGNNDIKDAYVESKIPEGLKVKGTTKGYFSINKNQENKIFSFTIIPEKVYSETDYIINFSLTYNDKKQYDITESRKIKIKPKQPSIKIKKTMPSGAYLGEILDVIYEIESQDTISDIKIIPPKNQFFDLYNVFSSNISKLKKGEKITIKGEQIKPKKIGKLDSGRSIILFKDEYGRLFNVSSPSIYIQVKEAQIEGPSVLLEKNISPDSIKKGETAQLTIKLTNLGTKIASGIIQDNYFNETELLIPFYESRTLTKNISYEESINLIPETAFTYEYAGDIIKAYSNELRLLIEPDTSNPDKIEYIENTEQHKLNEDLKKEKIVSEEKEIAEKKQGFFQKIFSWFVKLFKKV